MNWLETYRLHISTLSPLHIGTGQAYDPTGYVIDGDTLHHFDTAAAMAALPPADRDKLLGLVSRRGDALLKDVQRFFYDRREALMAHATLRLPVIDGVAKLYESRIGQTANREDGGREVINKLAVERNAFDPVRNRPVLCGSSLKGAMRTAVLDHYNEGWAANEKKGLHEFQGRILKYAAQDGRLKLERDPFRLLQIGDAAWSASDDLPAGEVLFAVNRKRVEVKDPQGNVRPARAENLYQTLECVPAARYRAFEAQLAVQDVEGLDAGGKLPAPDRRFGMAALVRHCNAFYRPILERELAELAGRDYVDPTWARTVTALLHGPLGQALEAGRAFLLRVGRHSGAESLTLNGVRRIKIMKGKGEDGKQKFDYEKMPLTWWLAASEAGQRSGLLPFGWLLVEVHGLNEPAPDWPALREALSPLLGRLRAWTQRRAQEERRLADLRAQAEARLAEQAAAALEKAAREERERAQAAARETARAGMTDQQRALDDFLSAFETAQARGAHQPGGVFDAQRLDFFKTALDWAETDDRRAAAALLRQTIQWTGWPGKKERKAEFREWLEQLAR
jgi:CRISPR-associated protein Csm5